MDHRNAQHGTGFHNDGHARITRAVSDMCSQGSVCGTTAPENRNSSRRHGQALARPPPTGIERRPRKTEHDAAKCHMAWSRTGCREAEHAPQGRLRWTGAEIESQSGSTSAANSCLQGHIRRPGSAAAHSHERVGGACFDAADMLCRGKRLRGELATVPSRARAGSRSHGLEWRSAPEYP